MMMVMAKHIKKLINGSLIKPFQRAAASVVELFARLQPVVESSFSVSHSVVKYAKGRYKNELPFRHHLITVSLRL